MCDDIATQDEKLVFPVKYGKCNQTDDHSRWIYKAYTCAEEHKSINV